MFKKLIAPVIVVVIVVALIALQTVPMLIVFPFWGKVLAFIIAACAIGAVIAVLVQRYREIKGGEEDDISKY